MQRFTKDAMLDELRFILLYEAEHIRKAASEEAAEHFIGFPIWVEDDIVTSSSYTMHMDRTKVDLGRFKVGRYFEAAYDFAFAPSLSDFIERSDIWRLVEFMDGIPRSRLSGDYPFMKPEGLCQTVADTAYARWNLDMEEGGSFTPREIALLANMSEGAVRNAMADKGENGLRTIPGSKPAEVPWEEAKRWLNDPRRRGFVRTPTRPSEDQDLREALAAVTTVKDLTHLIWRHGLVFDGPHVFEDGTGGDPTAFKIDRSAGGFDALAWSPDEIKAWREGTFTFDVTKAQELARALDFDVPRFVGKALEVSLRRDAQAKGGRS